MKRKVVSLRRVGNGFACKLECGHTVYRPVKRRRTAPFGKSEEDRPPSWAYCKKCQQKEKV